MQHLTSLETINLRRTWLTIGVYDGVHRGHRTIINQLTAGAHAVGAPAVVLSFHPHPARVLNPHSSLQYLTTPERRAELFGDLGIDVVVTLPFTHDFAQQPGRAFLASLHTRLDIEALWVGYDFAMGRNRDTDAQALQALSGTFGFQLNIVHPVAHAGEVISSSRIRSLLLTGEIAAANQLLGWQYCLSGAVIPGDGRGRTIGIPTANLDFWDEQVLPASGVYACRAAVDGQEYLAATNIGVRPTFDGGNRRHVEAHLLDADLDLYGKSLRLTFIERLRGEIKFPNVQALVSQINQDIEHTRRLLQS
jgi:riboflavin kinase/FMN adenylyltransferase